MTNVVQIELSDGVAKIDAELFQGYIKEAFEYLGTIEEAQQSLKEVVETVAETTGLKKGTVSKYLKQRFEAKTKETKELGELFAKLDETVG